MNLVTIGINHRTAPLEVREKLWYSADELRSVLSVIRDRWFSECFVVSTCNRTEVYGIPSASNGSLPTLDNLGQFLIDTKSAQGHVNRSHLYLLNSVSAVSHLFRVASGVDSMVVGDVQILNQLKEGFNLAQDQKTTGVFLNRLVQSAYRVGKRARTESHIGEGAVSISYAAVELASKIFENLSKKSALLVGAGETGELTARHLTGKGIGRLLIANRTREKAEELSGPLGGSAVGFDQLTSTMAEVDIVMTSVESQQPIITSAQLFDVMKRRLNKPLFVIDIGVPRNVERSAHAIENLFLHDLDSLLGIVDQNLEMRKAQIPKVNAIILEELKEFYAWYSSLEVNPTIADLHSHFEGIRRGEVSKHMNRFSSPNDRELLELVTKRIVNKLLHLPTTMLKNDHEEPDEVKRKRIHILRTLFGLNNDAKKDS
ncbi:MAG: glutamyl-tRNA reductase [Ignavibacteriales bacterium]|nr:glutamyl-tRNA reductase [Ignavibacteriales bacterium]